MSSSPFAAETIPWDAVVIYQVDERVAPPDDRAERYQVLLTRRDEYL